MVLCGDDEYLRAVQVNIVAHHVTKEAFQDIADPEQARYVEQLDRGYDQWSSDYY